MDDMLRQLYQQRASNPNTLGILMMEKRRRVSPETDNFDYILLVIVQAATDKWAVEHYLINEKLVAVHIVDKELLTQWIRTSRYRRASEWMINGKVLFDRNEYVKNLKERLRLFPMDTRKLRLAIEFSKITRSYSEAKNLYETGDYLDAYSAVVQSLHYLGRIAVIEKGFFPEVVVWNQVKRIDPEVYKIYEELLRNTEELKKRVELMLIALDFALNERTEVCSQHLIEIMSERKEPWLFAELKTEKRIEPYMYDLVSMLEYLTEKSLVKVVEEATDYEVILARKYSVIE
ncbi:hypothetical protein GGQ92_003058 [Gracilibacillus halotolerans]|uniref:Nucleotidyltransferase-like n=1 Tax=Gracilibacillus halotolerans TaxID=74386 RepID=A0A841RSQ6_9BACI|nr:hypothetical protein [Gracilibacillus halotolerans]